MKAGIFFAAALGVVVGLQAEVTWSGDVVVPAGEDVTCSDLAGITSLDIGAGATVRFTTATPHAFPITGSGTIIKESADDWTMTTAIPNFQGDYEIAAGTVSINIANAFGQEGTAYKVTVKSGATLVLVSSAGKVISRYVNLAGTGAAGHKGALEFPAESYTSDWLNRIKLDDDATLFIPTGGLFFLYDALDLDGHRLTIIGGGAPTLMDRCVISATGEIYVQKTEYGSPQLWFRSWVHTNPSFQVTPRFSSAAAVSPRSSRPAASA